MTSVNDRSNVYGLVRCAADGTDTGVSMTPAARDRLVAGNAPHVPCPRCRGQCGARFIEARPHGEGNLLVHQDDDNGGRWAIGFTFMAQM